MDFAGFQGLEKPSLERIAIRIFAADHGVVAEGVSAFPQAVTGQMIHNFAAGGAAICVLARQAKADFAVINVGTVAPLPPLPGVVNLQLAAGTANFCLAEAMDETLFAQALAAGRDAVPANCQLFVGGEMGIGNTTAAAAIFAALLELPARDVVGRGTGVDAAGLARKQSAVVRGLQRHPGRTPEQVLRCLGGLEIAALAGAYIAAAQRGIPSLVDGFITTAAALCALRINPSIQPWLLFGHRSAEAAHRLVLEKINAQPLLDFDLRLGEGSGAALALGILQAALCLHNDMATFAEAGVADG